ncbi:MAG: phosphoribosylformylglycinamidine synthase [Oscillospiraceae bacterium]|nr:phosphoribosylformylglycinamidine synthase [Oscillospiraceae bacterium]
MTRIIVEKKESFRFDEKNMLLEIRDVLNVPGITKVRIFNGYDIEGIKDIEKAKLAVFSEPGQDIVYEDILFDETPTHIFTTTAAIGQYDQCEDFATQLLHILEPDSKPIVRTFKKIALYGDISETEINEIKSYYINPLELRELPLKATSSTELPTVAAKPQVNSKQEKHINHKNREKIETLNGFIKSDDIALEKLAKTHNITMTLDNLKLCREYFTKERRDPTITEMKVLDTYWSDHCRHSTFMTVIENVKIIDANSDANSSANINIDTAANSDIGIYIDADGNCIADKSSTAGLRYAQDLYEQAKSYVYGDENQRPLCFMDIATMEMKKLRKSGDLDDMEQSDEVNACSIEVTVPINGKPTDMLVMFKNETHNHPTEMEPFGGASTCLGGAIRDPLSGRAYVYGAIRVTGSGDPRESIEDTIPGKLSQRKITQTAAEGYSSYGNGIGLSLGHLIEVYDPGFKAKRLECGAVVAAAKKADITRGTPQPGDVVVLVGGKTGRDGCGGATGSSKEHDDDSLEKGGAEVQKGNPVIERNILRLFRKPFISKMIKICNDFGAGGVCVAVTELADGLTIDLNKIPVKYPGLNGTELAISESQERMAVVLEANDLDTFLTEAAKENLIATKIADITNPGQVIMTWQGDEIFNIKSEFLNSGGVRQNTNITVSIPDWKKAENPVSNIKNAWLKNLADLNICSKKGIADRFDSTAGGGTVFMPYGGVHQKTPEQGLAMRLPLREGETDFGTLMTVGYNPTYSNRSPFHAAMYAVIESIMKIAAMGGDYRKTRLSFQEYFEKLTSEESWGKPYAALMGAFLAQDELKIPAIGGKDSMSGTFKDINVPPSLISFAVAVVDTTKLVSRAFKGIGNSVYLLKTPVDENGIPNFKVLKRNMSTVFSLIQYGCVKSASVVGMGGIAATVSEMAFGNGIGFSFDEKYTASDTDFITTTATTKVTTTTNSLFTPEYTSMILELDKTPKDKDGLRSEFIFLGTTSKNKNIDINGVTIPLDEAQKAWEGTLGSVFPIEYTPPIYTKDSATSCHYGLSKINTSASATLINPPNVLIPVFPGTTGEYELEKQFIKAGAKVTVSLFRTLTTDEIKDSYNELTEAINNTDILAIPSGMSAGAEPDGGSKLIALILRQESVKKAINKLVNERKGLVLGIGEGFKALLKTGMIQTGEIQDIEYGDIVLAKNPSGRYHCALKSVKIEQIKSPWLNDMSGEIETVPVSGQDSMVHMPDDLFDEYLNNNQIAARYVNETPKCEGSPISIEAMVSKNGLVLGRTGLVENLKKGLYTNVFNAKESRIFTNAVQYITHGR